MTAPDDEPGCLRARVTELEPEVARLKQVNQQLLTEWKLAEEQAARLVQMVTSQHAAALNLAQGLKNVRQRALEVHLSGLEALELLVRFVEGSPGGPAPEALHCLQLLRDNAQKIGRLVNDLAACAGAPP